MSEGTQFAAFFDLSYINIQWLGGKSLAVKILGEDGVLVEDTSE
jgi:hypothetical protein